MTRLVAHLCAHLCCAWMASQAAISAPAALGDEAVSRLQGLIRHDTVNPPGNEHVLQAELSADLRAVGFECELVGAERDRPNLIARLPGISSGPTLTFLGHVDTVRADRDEWKHDPWGGELVDGEVWGRGALDMKGQVACEVAAAVALAKGGWRPAKGELLLVITCDEETGGEIGAHWLCAERPDLVRSDYVVNEGGGASFEYDGHRVYPLCVAEKGVMRFRITTTGRAGHASQPRVGENALLHLAPLIQRLAEQPPPEPSSEGLQFLSALEGAPLEPEQVPAALARLRAESPELVDWLAEPMLGITVTPTKVSASEKINVIPSVAQVTVDCRVPPGMGEDEVRDRIGALLGPGDYGIEFTERIPGNASPSESTLRGAIEGWLADVDPGAVLAPMAMTGFSDSNAFRTAFPEATVYGFFPQRTMGWLETAPLIHGADERIPSEDLAFAAGFFFELAQRVLGEDS